MNESTGGGSMARRRGNMLEAFQVSREKSLQAQRAAEKAVQREGEGLPNDSVAQRLQRKVKGLTGPAGSIAEAPAPVKTKGLLDLAQDSAAATKARSARPVVDFPEPGAAAAKKELDRSITLAMGPVGLFVSALALITISFWGGYRIGERHGSAGVTDDGTAGVQQAAWMDLSAVPQDLPDPGAVPDLGPQAVAGAETLADGTYNAADLAFEDPSNHFTLVVDQHSNNDVGWDRALASYQYLRSEGFPAIYPRERGAVVYLLVGAAPDGQALEALLKEVHSLAYPGSTSRTFSSAFQEKIENFF
ncbi:MAG: hypothetical protein P1V35_05985 [Planctomycetota bacterium]|nr:hypothetical protein [Planctomycetota bacterium]